MPTAGLTYCAVGALALLKQMPDISRDQAPLPTIDGIAYEDLLRWLVARQTNYIEDQDDEDEHQGTLSTDEVPFFESPRRTASPQPPQRGALPSDRQRDEMNGPLLNVVQEELQLLGFNGRPNKIADTCYCFWNTGALAVSQPTILFFTVTTTAKTSQALDRLDLVDQRGLCNYLLGKTQHIVGGFGKTPGEPPGR